MSLTLLPREKAVRAKRKRAAHLLRSYGISPRQYNKMLKLQGGVCKICGKKPKPGQRLNVDHDHGTKRVRGLLCFYCNKYRVAKLTAEFAERVMKYLLSTFDGRDL